MHSRVDLACEQLEVAIELFVSEKSDVSALTLAGAAEEILGVELKNRGLENALQKHYAARERLLDSAERSMFPPKVKMKRRTWKAHTIQENSARNAAKHIADRKASSHEYDEFFRADPRSAAGTMISRALLNQRNLSLPVSAAGERFERWYFFHVRGMLE